MLTYFVVSIIRKHICITTSIMMLVQGKHASFKVINLMVVKIKTFLITVFMFTTMIMMRLIFFIGKEDV